MLAFAFAARNLIAFGRPFDSRKQAPSSQGWCDLHVMVASPTLQSDSCQILHVAVNEDDTVRTIPKSLFLQCRSGAYCNCLGDLGAFWESSEIRV